MIRKGLRQFFTIMNRVFTIFDDILVPCLGDLINVIKELNFLLSYTS